MRGALAEEEGAPQHPPVEVSGLNPNFETVLFGLVCALGGGVLSLVALGRSWSAIFSLYAAKKPIDGLPLHIVGVVTTAFAGSLLMALFLAGLVRSFHFSGQLRSLEDANPPGDGVPVGLGHGAWADKMRTRPGELRSARRQARWWVAGALVGLLATGFASWGISLIHVA